MTGLERLGLQGAVLDKAAVERIARLPNLKKLGIGKCKVDERAMGAFQKARPDLKIERYMYASLPDGGKGLRIASSNPMRAGLA